MVLGISTRMGQGEPLRPHLCIIDWQRPTGSDGKPDLSARGEPKGSESSFTVSTTV